MVDSSGLGHIKLSDGAVLKFKITIIDVKEIGWSPFGGIDFDVNAVGGVSTETVPDEIKKVALDKPVAPPEPPKDGWDLVDIIEQKSAFVEEVVDSSKERFRIRVEAEIVMVSRNLSYKTRSASLSIGFLGFGKFLGSPLGSNLSDQIILVIIWFLMLLILLNLKLFK